MWSSGTGCTEDLTAGMPVSWVLNLIDMDYLPYL